MNHTTSAVLSGCLLVGLAGCHSTPPEDRGPDHTEAYYIQIESSVPGVTIQTNGVAAGVTPLSLKVFGDDPGRFHDFGNSEYVIRALPGSTNQFLQTRVFHTGKGSVSGDRIPGVIFFDMNQPNGGVSIDSIPEK